MATYFARGGVNDNITTSDKRGALAQALKVIGRPLRKVLVLPPDHTRLNSDAGELTRLLYEMLTPKVELDIMPTLGTHTPMSAEKLRMMFGDSIPLDRFKVHDWRKGVRHVGDVPGRLLKEWSEGRVDYDVRVVASLNRGADGCASVRGKARFAAAVILQPRPGYHHRRGRISAREDHLQACPRGLLW